MDLAQQKYSPTNVCIYCGTIDDLRDEHIISSGLGGKAILPKSTCGKCSIVTGRIERFVLRGSMRSVRVFLKLRSRRPNDVPTEYPIRIIRGNRAETIGLPLEEYPILLPMPIFDIPSFLSGDEETKGIKIIGVDTISFGPRPEEVGKKIKAKIIEVTPEKDFPNEFARMLAKIIYVYATAELGLSKTKEAFVLPAILGQKDDIGRWVGTIRRETEPKKNLLHRLKLIQEKEKQLLLGEVQLFADSLGPTYGIVIGKSRANA